MNDDLSLAFTQAIDKRGCQAATAIVRIYE